MTGDRLANIENRRGVSLQQLREGIGGKILQRRTVLKARIVEEDVVSICRGKTFGNSFKLQRLVEDPERQFSDTDANLEMFVFCRGRMIMATIEYPTNYAAARHHVERRAAYTWVTLRLPVSARQATASDDWPS